MRDYDIWHSPIHYFLGIFRNLFTYDSSFAEITSCTSTLGEEGYKLNVESQIAKFAADIFPTLKISEVKIAYEV